MRHLTRPTATRYRCRDRAGGRPRPVVRHGFADGRAARRSCGRRQKGGSAGARLADVAQLAGFIVLPSGYAEEAVALCEKAMTLSPDRPSVYRGTLGDAYRQAGRTDDAIAAFEAYHARNPGFGLTDVVIAYQEKSQPEEAKRTAARLMAARPESTIAGWRKTQFIRRDAARVEADAAALRAAGLPTG